MRKEYSTLAGTVRYECTIKGSRFIAVSGPCGSDADLDDALVSARAEYPNATHYCYAAIYNGTDRFSDNGEPSGTAGRPILQVLKGSGIDNVFCIVVRYFGGTLLGTGGLVQAYSGASAESLKGAVRVKMALCRDVSFRLRYDEYGRFMAECRDLTAGDSQEFSDSVLIRAYVPDDDYDMFFRRLSDITKGNVSVTENGQGFRPLG